LNIRIPSSKKISKLPNHQTRRKERQSDRVKAEQEEALVRVKNKGSHMATRQHRVRRQDNCKDRKNGRNNKKRMLEQIMPKHR